MSLAQMLARLGRWIKSALPTTIYGRSIVMILLPLALLQVVVAVVFFELHWTRVSRRLAEGAAAKIAFVIADFPPSRAANALSAWTTRAEQNWRLRVAFMPDAALPPQRRRNLFPAFDGTLRRALEARIDAPFWIDSQSDPIWVEVRIRATDGIFQFIAAKDRTYVTTGPLFLAMNAAGFLIVASLSLLFVRNQVRPIQKLAAAANAFGRGREAPRFKPGGAREVRDAAQALIDMRDRIRAHNAARTLLLAGVSHDLRTPITRLKLALTLMAPDEEIAACRADLTEMEAILADYLTFAEGAAGEPTSSCALGALIATTLVGLPDSSVVEIDVDPTLHALVRPQAMRRALRNGLENALRHGTQVKVSAAREVGKIILRIDDNGPGLSPDLFERAFEPFTQLATGADRKAGQSGLGLAIVRDILRQHGGEARLAASPLGGLALVLEIPS